MSKPHVRYTEHLRCGQTSCAVNRTWDSESGLMLTGTKNA